MDSVASPSADTTFNPKIFNAAGEPQSFKDSSAEVKAFYFSAHWCPPCQNFTPKLAAFYNAVNKDKKRFEVVFVSGDEDEEHYKEYYKTMPWLTVAFTDPEKDSLNEKYDVEGIPCLVLVDANGNCIKKAASADIWEFKAEEPETVEKIMKNWAYAYTVYPKIQNGTYTPNLVDKSGSKVSLKDSPAKFKALYFSAHWCPPCQAFTPKLAEFYKAINKDSKRIEVVFVSSDKTAEEYQKYYAEMPWTTIDYNDPDRGIVKSQYGVQGIPCLILIDEKGKALYRDAVGDLRECTPENYEKVFERWSDVLSTLKKIDEGAYTPNIFDAAKKPVNWKTTPGKVKAFYFSAHWCPPCRQFTPKLAAFYNAINKDSKKVEVAFISSDKDEASYADYYKEMPWLTLDFSDKEKSLIKSFYKVSGIPCLVIVDEKGKPLLSDGVGDLWECEEAGYQKVFDKWSALYK
jgi:nucleoredoxin